MSDVKLTRDVTVITKNGETHVIPEEVAVHCSTLMEMSEDMEPGETTPIPTPEITIEVLEKIIESFNIYNKIDSSSEDRIPTSPGDCINIRPGDRVLVDTTNTTDTTAVADAADAADGDNKESWKECVRMRAEKEFKCEADGKIYREEKGPKLQVVRAMNDLKKQEKIKLILSEKLFSKLGVDQIYQLFEGLEFLGFDPNSKFKQDLMGFYAIHLINEISVTEMKNMHTELDISVGEEETQLVADNPWILMFAEKCWAREGFHPAFQWEGRGDEQRMADKKVIFHKRN